MSKYVNLVCPTLILLGLLASLACGTEEPDVAATIQSTVTPTSTATPVLVPTEVSPSEERESPTTTVPTTPTSVVATTSVPTPTSATPPTYTPKPTTRPTATLEPTATPEVGFESGTYRVGSDIQPGIYVGKAGNNVLDSCYWARLSGVSGELSDVIANDIANGQFFVEVMDTDK